METSGTERLFSVRCPRAISLKAFESATRQAYVIQMINECGGDKQLAAKRLRTSYATVQRILNADYGSNSHKVWVTVPGSRALTISPKNKTKTRLPWCRTTVDLLLFFGVSIRRDRPLAFELKRIGNSAYAIARKNYLERLKQAHPDISKNGGEEAVELISRWNRLERLLRLYGLID